MTKPHFLTLAEINKLINSPIDTKIDIVKNIAQYYKNGKFEEGQIRIAEQVFRSLLRDTEVVVRKTLSESIKSLEGVPYDVIMNLARDIEEVSLPVLEYSKIISDVDIIDIISNSKSEKQQIAISNRKNITEKVADALIETENEKVVGSLIKNKDANISEQSYNKVVKNHSNSEMILSLMVERGSLPVQVVERLTATISNELYQKLLVKHKSSMEKLQEAVKKSHDIATKQVMAFNSTEEDLRKFMKLMKKINISENLVPIAALAMANLNLFEFIISRNLGVPVINVKELIKDESNKGFKAIYERAALPTHFFDISSMLIDILRVFRESTDPSGSIKLSKSEANRFIEQIMLKVEEKGAPENLNYMLALIRNNAESI